MSPSKAALIAEKLPPHAYFVVSALSHYLGPSFAVLLFARIEPLGVAWLRLASAATIFGLWRKPWRYVATLSAADRWTMVALGFVLAGMNSLFYLAIARLPLGTVGAIEFLGPIGLAAGGVRSTRNVVALAIAIAGFVLLTDVKLVQAPLGYVYAFANCALFTLYIVLGHKLAGNGGIDRLAASMIVATVVALPIGFSEAAPAFVQPVLLAATVGVGISSSVIPYVTDQLAMARLPRATFAIMLSILPAVAALIGFLVLKQVPGIRDMLGIAMVIVAVGLHRPAP